MSTRALQGPHILLELHAKYRRSNCKITTAGGEEIRPQMVRQTEDFTGSDVILHPGNFRKPAGWKCMAQAINGYSWFVEAECNLWPAIVLAHPTNPEDEFKLNQRLEILDGSLKLHYMGERLIVHKLLYPYYSVLISRQRSFTEAKPSPEEYEDYYLVVKEVVAE